MIVYRLQDSEGNGPFHGEQLLSFHLTYHKDPHRMLKSANLNRKSFNRLCNNKFIFGWSSKDLADKFLTKKGRKIYKSLGFSWVELETDKFFIFEDGQVLFKHTKRM